MTSSPQSPPPPLHCVWRFYMCAQSRGDVRPQARILITKLREESFFLKTTILGRKKNPQEGNFWLDILMVTYNRWQQGPQRWPVCDKYQNKRRCIYWLHTGCHVQVSAFCQLWRKEELLHVYGGQDRRLPQSDHRGYKKVVTGQC